MLRTNNLIIWNYCLAFVLATFSNTSKKVAFMFTYLEISIKNSNYLFLNQKVTFLYNFLLYFLIVNYCLRGNDFTGLQLYYKPRFDYHEKRFTYYIHDTPLLWKNLKFFSFLAWKSSFTQTVWTSYCELLWKNVPWCEVWNKISQRNLTRISVKQHKIVELKIIAHIQ